MRMLLSAILAAMAIPVSAGTWPEVLDGEDFSVSRGIVDLYSTGEKIYVGLPLSLCGKSMMLGTMVEKISDPMESSSGYQPHDPMLVSFTVADSTVYLCRDNIRYCGDGTALRQSHIPSVLEAFDIEESDADSTKVLFDATAFFLRTDDRTDPIDPKAYNGAGGLVKRTGTHISGSTVISGADAFDDNFSVAVCHTYKVKSALLGVFAADEKTYLTAQTRRAFVLLPDQPMERREADVRIGTYTVALDEFRDDGQRSRKRFFSEKWRLETDSTGTVMNPVCFYVDTLFPASWIPYIFRSVEKWNAAFGKAGYKGALTARLYPEEDAAGGFNGSNVKYSCIRYNFSLSDRIADTRYADPRTGEILSAQIYVDSGISGRIHRDLLVQTSAADSLCRLETVPDSLFGAALSSRLLRSIGHCLGFTDNMAASFAYSPDSLFSASFTGSHGLAASVMDELPFNFVGYSSALPPGHPLPAIVQENLGVYDYHAVRWLYGRSCPESIDRNDPALEYGKRQSPKVFYDPRSMSLDLGNDFVISAGYGFEGLANVIPSLSPWMDGYDIDYSLRSTLQESIIMQAYEYIKQVFVNVGGIYLYPGYQGEDVEPFRSVPAETQRRCLLWAMERIDDLSFLDDAVLDRNWQLTGSTADFCQKYFARFIFMQIDAMWLSEIKSEEQDPYTQMDAMADVNGFIWKEALAGEELSDLRKFEQVTCLDYLLMWSGLSGGLQKDIHRPERTHIWYGMLQDVSELLAKAARKAPSEADRNHYAYMEYRIRKAME